MRLDFSKMRMFALMVCVLAMPSRGFAEEPSGALAQADGLLIKGRYAEALKAYTDLRSEAGASGDRRTVYIAAGGMGLANAALGNLMTARAGLSESAEQARSEFPDIASKSAYNAALIEARYQDVVPSNLLWLPRLRQSPIVKPAPETTAVVLREAQAAMRDSESAPDSSVYARARILFVNYAYDGVQDARVLRLLAAAWNAVQKAPDVDTQLALADAAIGRMALAPQSPAALEYSKIALAALQPLTQEEATKAYRTRAIGLLGRLYGLAGRHAEAMALTGEASLMARDNGDVALELEFDTQYAALLEASGNRTEAEAAYGRLDTLISAVQPALGAQFDLEQRGNLRHLMSMAITAHVGLILDGRAPEAADLYRARHLLELNKVIDFEAYFASPCLQQWSEGRRSIDVLIDAHTAVIYPVVFEDRTDVLVAFNGQIKLYTGAVTTRANLLRHANIVRDALRDSGSSGFEPSAQALYDILLRPAIADIRQAGITTLVFAPNKELRGVPLQALHDGSDYIVRTYAVATAVALDLVDTTPMNRRHSRTLIGGVTRGKLGQTLLGVESEVANVAKVTHAVTLENQAFTRDALLTAVPDTGPTVIHIASHGQFGRTPEDSFVLAYDKPMSFEDIRTLVQTSGSRGLDLLTLSACETAKGDDDALLGLAGIAYQAGARSVVATLWKQDDTAGAKVMKRFYTGVFVDGTSKAESLRLAQIERLDDPATRHPYYWAAYVVVGNWQ